MVRLDSSPNTAKKSKNSPDQPGSEEQGPAHNSRPATDEAHTVASSKVFAANLETISPLLDNTDAGIKPDGSKEPQPQESGPIGSLINYRILRLLGKGGMGLVYLAEDMRLQRQVALKVMQPGLVQDDTARERFLREARVTATIRSDHIVTIHEVGVANNCPFLVQEFLQGQTLDTWMEKSPRPVFTQIRDFGVQIAKGLNAAHQAGIIHRDIKPANIWVEPCGRIKLLDFGLAHAANKGADLTLDGAVLGTPAYMAPEQADGQKVDARCDLFSLGCVLYEMGAGERPFKGNSVAVVLKATALHNPKPLHEINPDLPRAFSELVMSLLEKDPKKRPESAAAVINSLESLTVCSELPKSQRLASISRGQNARASSHTSNRRRKIAAVVAGVILASATLVLALPLILNKNVESSSPAELHTNAEKSHNSAAVKGVTDDEILLGLSAPFSGPARELGRKMEIGLRTYFHHVNSEGGIHGRKLKLVALDDGYQPERALANMHELCEQRGVFAVIGNVGTATAEKTMPYARSKKVIFFGAATGASLLRNDPPDRYVFNYRASYAEETSAIVTHLVEIKGLRPEQIAVFAQQDAYGEAGLHGVVKTLRKYGTKPSDILCVGHPRNSVDVRDAVKEILAHKELRAVVMVSTYRPAAQFIVQLKNANASLLFANVSFVGAEALAEEVRELSPSCVEGIIVTQVVPHPASEATVVIRYRELLEQIYPNEQPSFGSLEGYLNAALFTEGLRRCGSNLDSESLVSAFEKLGNLDIGLGSPLHFGPSEHQASHRVWGTILDKSGQYRILDLD